MRSLAILELILYTKLALNLDIIYFWFPGAGINGHVPSCISYNFCVIKALRDCFESEKR